MPALARGGDQPIEVLERAELRVDRGVAALASSRSPTGCPGSPGARRPARCCVPCDGCGRSGGSAAGRQRRSRARRGRQAVCATPAQPAEGAREELIPGAEASAQAVDVDSAVGAMQRRARAVGVALAAPSQRRRRVRARVARRSRDLRIGERRRSRLDQLARSAPAGARAAAGDQQRRALEQLGGEVLPPGGDLALRAHRARWPRRRSRPRPPSPSAPARSTVKEPAQRSPPRSASTRCHRRLAPLALARAAVAHDGAQQVVAVAKDRRADLDAVADAGLDGVAPAVEQRLRILDVDAAAGGLALDLRRHMLVVSRYRGARAQSCRPRSSSPAARAGSVAAREHPALERRPAAPHLAARRAPGAEAFAFVDWLAAAGQSWWQMLPLGPPDRHGSPYKSRSAFAASRGAARRSATRRSRAPRRPRSASATPSGSATGSASPAGAGRCATRSASSASGRRCAATPRRAACA